VFDWITDRFGGETDWGVIDDSGQWRCFRVSEHRARDEFQKINYGKLVNNIRSNNKYNTVEENGQAHT